MQTEEKMYLKIESSWGLGDNPGTSTYILDGNELTIEKKSFFSIRGNEQEKIILNEQELSLIKEKYNKIKSYVEENKNKPEMMMYDASYSVEIGPEKSRIKNDMDCYDQAQQLFDELVLAHSTRSGLFINDRIKEIVNTRVIKDETPKQNPAVEKPTTDQPNVELPTQSDPEISPLNPNMESTEKIYIKFNVFGGLSGIITTYEINDNILTYKISSAIYPEKNSIRQKKLSNEEMLLVKEKYKELKEYAAEQKNDKFPILFDAGWSIEIGQNGIKIENDNKGYKMVRQLFAEIMDEYKELKVQGQAPVQEPKTINYLKEKYPYLFDEEGNLKMDTERILGVLNDMYKNNTYQNNENKSISM